MTSQDVDVPYTVKIALLAEATAETVSKAACCPDRLAKAVEFTLLAWKGIHDSCETARLQGAVGREADTILAAGDHVAGIILGAKDDALPPEAVTRIVAAHRELATRLGENQPLNQFRQQLQTLWAETTPLVQRLDFATWLLDRIKVRAIWTPPAVHTPAHPARPLHRPETSPV